MSQSPMHILHLLDASVGWEQRVAVRQLLAKLPATDYQQSVATIDKAIRHSFASKPRQPWQTEPPPSGGEDCTTRTHSRPAASPDAKTAVASDEVEIALLPRRWGLPALAGPAVRRFVARQGVDLIHAWGIGAATAARAACPGDAPLAVSVFQPGVDPRDIRVLRTIGSIAGFAVCCAAERVRRRLVEQGVSFEQAALIRPGVDFAQVTDWKRTANRELLGAPARGLLVLAAPPPFDEGHDATLWSVMMRRYFDENARVVIAGRGRRLERLRRLAEAGEHPQTAIFTGERIPFEALCAVADYLVIGSRGDISTTCLAWAMASGTPIIAAATHATSEILAHDLNALLFKADPNWPRRGAKLCALYDQTANLPKIKEVARSQAYEVFSQRRFIEQHRQLYDNLRAGESPSRGLTDPAMVGV